MYDQKLLDFHNKMTMLSLKKSQIESRSYMSAFAPENCKNMNREIIIYY